MTRARPRRSRADPTKGQVDGGHPRPLGGLEPPTSGLAIRRSIRLSYKATRPAEAANRQ